MALSPFEVKYRAFGWHVIEIDGHDMGQILDALQEAETIKGRPTCIMAYTVKGKGIDFCEDVCSYHGVPPVDGRSGDESLEACVSCLGGDDDFPPERIDALLQIAEDYQRAVDRIVDESMPQLGLSRDWWWNSGADMHCEMDATRNGFGIGIAKVSADPRTIAFGADITGSIRMDRFYCPDGKNNDPEREKRFFSMGIHEPNMTTVAAGFAANGKVGFIGSYGVFITGRNWDQLRTTVAYNDYNVKIADAHGGVSVGPDGATHQALEEISLITCIPGFNMVVPCDAAETAKATEIITWLQGPAVVRFAREATPVVTTAGTPFEFGKANVIRYRGLAPKFIDAFETVLAAGYAGEDEDLAIIACGPAVPEAMRAAMILKEEKGIETRVLNVHTVKPLDTAAIAAAARDTGRIVTAEEHQVGGFGNLVAGVVAQSDIDRPVSMRMIGVQDTFGDSGQPWELMKVYGLCAEHIVEKALQIVK